MAEEKVEHKDFIVFVGLRAKAFEDGDPEALFAWLTREEGERQRVNREITNSELQSYSVDMVKNLKWCNPGSVYMATKTEKGLSYHKKATPVFTLSNEQVTRWHTLHRAVERDWEASKRLKRDATARPDRELLEPFRVAYNRLHGPAQAQLIADMVAYVTRGRPKTASK